MHKTICVKFFIVVLGGLMLTSCATRKKLVYFQDETDGATTTEIISFTPKLEVGDIVSVEITGTDPEVAAPFNQTELVRQGNQIGSYQNGVPATYGYLIDSDSTVSLPIIGKVNIAGLNRVEAIVKIEDIAVEYLENPKVAIRILNFKITVLGEVRAPGSFSIPNERITILEAIGIAHDLKITGERRNVLVIRLEDGVKKEYRVDLTSKEVFSSPVYFLKQNDIIYVEPNKKSRYDASIFRSTGGIIISATSLIISTLIIITNKP
jgi:polysaccharide biosynthesis/export protein